ncbi:MAG: AAA family ATPase [Clostridium sp.]|nr:AAA family ATPase [Clostridium sp.]
MAFYRADQIQISPASVLISADDEIGSPSATISPIDEPLQLIFYGAPGTGKSFKIDGMTDDNNTVRTTFHPDSDYASFVGAYKPTMQSMPIHAFVGTTVHHASNAANEKAFERKIVYKYVPQAFLKAYVAAWKDLENPHFLVIEEINRGNCAQIFGDLFQLLDRNSQGASSYAINADEDISQFLRDDENGFAKLPEGTAEAIRSFVLQKDNGKTEVIGADILSGKKLLLPPNLYIWATMNTSDQSLFPIDSAFKRRWNWEYIPIRFFDKDPDPSLSNRSFEIGKTRYSWADFLRTINPIISELTESADKQMGFFFAKPDKKSDPELKDNDVISEKVFLNKVLFYLWTDVLKDFNVGREEFKKLDGKNLEFTDFFEEGNTYLADFVAKLSKSTEQGIRTLYVPDLELSIE